MRCRRGWFGVRCIASLCVVVVGAENGSCQTPDDTSRFVHESYADFIGGELDSGGQNLYVSQDGTIRSINRFDVNDDGFLDVLFNCTHNTHQMLPATVANVKRGRNVESRDLPVEGARQIVLGDLNHDTYTDAVICPNAIGVHHDRRFLMVAWGGPSGWSRRQISTPLPMNAATSVALVDLNHDGWLDIAALGARAWMPGQPSGQIVRVYWGSELGFAVNEMQDFGIASAIALAAADFDGDSYPELVALSSNGRATLLWGSEKNDGGKVEPVYQELVVSNDTLSPTCIAVADLDASGTPDLVFGTTAGQIRWLRNKGARMWEAVEKIDAFPATHLLAADIDADDHVDLVLTNFEQGHAAGGEQAGANQDAAQIVRVMWGSANGIRQEATELSIGAAVATAAGDLDGDGHVDLAVAVHQGKSTFAGESVVYYGDGQRKFERGAATISTAGTTHVVIAPPEVDMPARMVFCNSIGGELDEAVPLQLYWGGSDGLDPERMWEIPFHSGYEGSAADLNADGFVDLVLLNSGHAGESSHEDPTLGANILWGGPKGLQHEKRRTVLHEHFLGTSSVADFNRDGYLDLVLEPFAPAEPGQPDLLIIYYGGPDGFDRSRRTAFPSEGYSQEHLVADLNHDGWLDITVTTRKFECARIFWGGPNGFDPTNEQRLRVAGPLGADAADFNGDGRLDLLVGSYNDPISGHRDMGLIIFWGSDEGFRHSNSQWLPGFASLGRTIADLDGDGHLDIFAPQQSGELTREDLACHIFWGSAEGFATRGYSTIFCDSVNDSLAGDFNGDGLLDLAVSCHTRHGDHRAESRVFYNDGDRFTNPRVQKLPTNGPHLMWATDLGNIADRSYRQTYVSPVVDWRDEQAFAEMSYKAAEPTGTRLDLQVRAASKPEGLPMQSWTDANDATYTLKPTDRCLQYRAIFRSDNGDRFPVLDRVEVRLK